MQDDSRPVRFRLRTLFLAFIPVAILLGLWRGYVVPAQREAISSACHGWMSQTRAAMLVYEFEYQTLPPARVVASDGTTLHGWRTVIAREFLFGDGFQRFKGAMRPDEPWDSKANLAAAALIKKDLAYFGCPLLDDSPNRDRTSFVVIVGPGTLFPGTEGVSTATIPEECDPALIFEISNSDIRWNEPRDLEIDSLDLDTTVDSLWSNHGDIRYLTLRGNLCRLPRTATVDDVRRAAMISPP